MMRVIKFRAWHKADEKMYRVYGFSQSKWFLRGKNFPMPLGAINLMQYTGLKDKNGKEIYEGDIVRVADEFGDVTVGKVEWGLSSKNYGTYPAFCIYEFESEMNSFAEIYDSGIYEIEVIGNIYEHRDLLEGK